jgi:hypothetical protein
VGKMLQFVATKNIGTLHYYFIFSLKKKTSIIAKTPLEKYHLHKMPRLITKISFIFYGLHDGPR